MKAAVLYEFDPSLTSPQFVRYEEVPDPKIEKTTDVIVRIGGALLIALGFVMAIGLWNQWMNSLQGLIYGFEVVI